MDRPLFTQEAASAGANIIALSIADAAAMPAVVAKVRLFAAGWVPDSGATRADFVANELVSPSYPAGGYSLTAFDLPKALGGGGMVVTSNLIEVAYTSGDPVACGGYWVEDAHTPTPRVRDSFIYDAPRPLGTIYDGWQIVVQLGYGANAVPAA